MTWKEFKEEVERLGVKDDSALCGIDLDFRFGEPGLDVVLTPDFDDGVMIYAATFGDHAGRTPSDIEGFKRANHHHLRLED